MLVQGISGVVKMSSKSAVKGCSFLIGAAALGLIGFVPSGLGMAAILAKILVVLLFRIPVGLPTGKKDAKFKEVFSKNRNINWFSLARVFLFGARDVWFVVGIPIYFYSVLSDGTPEGKRTAFFIVGTFMAFLIVLYGTVQASAPKLLRAKDKTEGEIVGEARFWVGSLFFAPMALALAAWLAGAPMLWLTIALVFGLLIFGGLFALNSYLILAFTRSERVNMDVGFYYMANAAGRLIGTLLSGITFQMGGLPICLGIAAAMIALSWLSIGQLTRQSPDAQPTS